MLLCTRHCLGTEGAAMARQTTCVDLSFWWHWGPALRLRLGFWGVLQRFWGCGVRAVLPPHSQWWPPSQLPDSSLHQHGTLRSRGKNMGLELAGLGAGSPLFQGHENGVWSLKVEGRIYRLPSFISVTTWVLHTQLHAPIALTSDGTFCLKGRVLLLWNQECPLMLQHIPPGQNLAHKWGSPEVPGRPGISQLGVWVRDGQSSFSWGVFV